MSADTTMKIPEHITSAHIEEAIRRIIRDGVPPTRKSRNHCLATKKGEHLPPKYTISLAHEVATGKSLRWDEFHGGPPSNKFLEHRGFDVIECNCGGNVRDFQPPS